jgi:nucleotidyltransferase/DNA polymerase involved in DNA repair
MSAGVACNKLLAKVAAGLHKPDQQTIVPPRCAALRSHLITGAP